MRVKVSRASGKNTGFWHRKGDRCGARFKNFVPYVLTHPLILSLQFLFDENRRGSCVYPDSVRIRLGLAKRPESDSGGGMKRQGFLDDESRRDLIELARDGSAAHRLARRANALVLLDVGKSVSEVAECLLLDEDTIRTWRLLYEEDGIDGLVSFGYEGSACRLDDEQQARLITWITETLPRSTRAIGAWIAAEFGLEYQSRSGLIALLHRLGGGSKGSARVARGMLPEGWSIANRRRYRASSIPRSRRHFSGRTKVC